jgi:hypothetical protein
MTLRWALIKPGAVVDKRRLVVDVVQGAVMNRAVLQQWVEGAGPDADQSVPQGRWVDVEVGDDGA